MEPLPRAFFDRETDLVARDLLGALLVRRLPDGQQLTGRIVETEAYFGPDDGASHARSGVTPRTTVMYGPLGHAYVYFIYGMHWMLNVVARRNHPAGAVLLRAMEPCQGLAEMRRLRGGRGHLQLAGGPARLCQALAVDGQLNQVDLCDPASPLWLAAGPPLPAADLASGPRVGVGYAPEPWRSRPLRFWIGDNPWVSGRSRPAQS